MDFSSFQQQLKDIEGLRQQVADRTDSLRAEAIKQVQEVIYLIGIKSTDLTFPDTPSVKTKPTRRVNPVAPKYRGPNGQTWSGRGKTPVWMAEALERGAKKEDFLI